MLRNVSTLGKKICQMNAKNIRSSNIASIGNVKQFSSLLDSKERGDENRFFREEEERNKAAIRAKFEKLLADQHGTEQQQEILEILEKKPDPESVISLSNWKFALPIGMIFGIPLLANEIIVLNAETQLLAVFILSLSLVYTQAGSMVAKTADDASVELEESFKKVDDSILSDYADDLAQNAALKSLEAEQKVLNQLVDDLNTSNAELMNYTIEHTYRDAIAKKLDALVAIEASVTNTVRTKMVASVTADALSQISKDRKIKDAVLDQAIAVLAAGPNSKIGKDIIGGVFQSSIKTYRDSYASKASEFDSTLKDLTKDIDAIATAPVVEEKGGNVYTNHAIKAI